MRSIVIAKLLLLLALIVGLCTYSEGNNEEDKEKDVLRSNHEVFKPTHEWQEVKPGQAIPRGLHVRMNMYSGKTEAKLLDPETSSETKPTGSTRTDVIAVSEVVEDTSEQPYMSPDELRKVLGQTGENSDLEVNMEEEVEKVKNKYRSYDELVKEFGNLNLAVKTDMELLLELTASAKQQLSGKIVEEDFVRTLTDIEYLVHQIDNGQEFIRLGGFTDVLLPALNVTSPKVRSEALWLLGSAAQSNPKVLDILKLKAVQIAALDAGCIPLLLRAAVLDPDEVVRTRAVYALSCLLRRFPTAQAKLMEEGGLAALGSIFDNDRTDELKTKLKIITLINDLVLEQHEVESTVKDLPQDLPDETNDTSTVEDAVKKLRRHQRGELLEKRRQYRSIALEEHLIVEGWCSRFSNLLVQLHKHSLGGGRVQRRDDLGSVLSKDIPFRPEHDVIEKVVECMLVLSDSCTPQFRADLELKEVLRELTHWYKDLGVREEMVQKENFLASTNNNPSSGNNYDQVNKELDFYYSSIAEKLHSLSQLLYESRTGPLHSKDEL